MSRSTVGPVVHDEADTANSHVQMFFAALAILGALALYGAALVFFLVGLRNRLTL